MQDKFRKGRAAMAAAACLIGIGSGAAVMRADLLLREGLSSALEQSGPDLSFQRTDSAHTSATLVGDEGFWLARASADNAIPFAKPLLVGDKITISGNGGADRHLEVMDLKVLGRTGTAAADADLVRSGLMLVVCRVIDGKGQEPNALVRFIVETAPPAQAPAPATEPKAL